MKKSFKKLVACLIAVLMVLSSMPLTAFAATVTAQLTVNAVGVLSSGSDNRFNNNRMNIVNDRQDSNFTIGFWKYNLSEIKSTGGKVTAASMLATLSDATIESDSQGLTFYYAARNVDSLSGGNNTLPSDIIGKGEGTHFSNAYSYYGLTEITTVEAAELSANKQITVDLVNAINSSVQNDLTYCTIMVMQKQAGSTASENGWTDTWVNATSTTVSATLETGSDLTGTIKVAPSKIGMLMTSAANDSGRLNTSTKDMNIVNDGESNSFSVGFWQYDLAGLKEVNANVTSAELNVLVNQAPDNDCQGLTFYVASKGDTTLTDGFNTASTVFSGSVSTWQANVISAYGLVPIATVSKDTLAANVNGTVSVELSNALNHAISLEKDVATIMVMQTQAGGTNSTGGWTDTHIGYDTSLNTVNCLYEVQIEDIEPGVQGLMNAISAYETKMSQVGSGDVGIYNNMADAYRSYVEACAALDAYRYGSDSANIDIETIAKNLVANTTKMTLWTDEVTGKYQSAVPTFTHTSTSEMQAIPEAYNNIIYTENCVGTNSDKNDGDTSGAAAIYDEVANFKLQLYYPNMILLFDGSTTGAKFPVMFMGRKTFGWPHQVKERRVYSVYPASDVSPNEFSANTGFVGANSDIYSMYWETGLDADNWHGGDNSGSGLNRLDFDATHNNGSATVGSTVGNPNGSYSANFGYSAGNYWNAYSNIFKINPDIEFEDYLGRTIGVKELRPYWVWYGGSNTAGAKTFNAGESMKGLKQASKKIYVLNYKYLMDAVKNTNLQKKLSNVSNYKEGGLAALITAFDNAVSYDLTNINLDNINAKGQEILDDVDALKVSPVADVDATGYNALRTEFIQSKRLIDKGNVNFENYTEETWTPFSTKYNEIQALYTSFYADSNKKISTDTAAQLAEELTELRLALVLNRAVVDTTTLEIVINNADRIASLSKYFVASSVSDTMAGLVEQAKIDIWGSEDNYTYESDKINDTAEHRALVQSYVDQILVEVNKAQLNLEAVSDAYGYNISTAITAGKAYEATKDNYSNYIVLSSAVNEAESFMADVPVVNGLVANMVENLVNRYISAVDAVGLAIATLRPSFTLIKDGTIANKGDVITTNLTSNTRPGEYRFGWQHNTNMVIFKVSRKALVFNLPTSTYTSYNKASRSNFETVVDSITLSAQADTINGEITSVTSAASGAGWPNGDFSLTESDKRLYAGNLAIVNNNVSIRQSNFKVSSKSSSDGIGFDASGNRIYDEATDFTQLLTTTEGTGSSAQRRPGGISALNGTTTFNATTTLTTQPTTGTATSNNGPAKLSVQVNTAVTRTNLGILYEWRYLPTLVQGWAGYAFAKSQMDLNVGFVDVSTLFEKIAELEAPEFVATENNYTKQSWDSLTAAISAAKKDLDYEKLSTYTDIVNECENRYQELFKAQRALKAPASNASLKAALADTKDTYENKKSLIEPSTWDQFETAYTTALSGYIGDYSDRNIREHSVDEQSAVDALAQQLRDAYSKLHFVVDFTPVDNAVSELVAGITDNKYTADSVEALLSGITNLPYFNISAEDRLTHYDSDTEFVNGLNEEATKTIPGLSKLLVESPVTTETVDATKAALRAAKNDPDAYDQDVITAALNKLTITKNILVYSKTVKAVLYATQAEADAAVAEALSAISLKTYTVTRDGETIGVYPYGSEVSIPSADHEKVDWYYESVSPTSKTDNKYMTTDTDIVFVVKGDTTLTTKKAHDTQTYKVSYVNGENSLVYAIDYVPAGTAVNVGTLSTGASADAPSLAYRVFSGFTIRGAAVSKGDTVTVNSDTRIIANYDLQADQGTYEVYVSNLAYNCPDLYVVVDGLSYNDEISFTKGSAEGEGYHGLDVYYQVNGETRQKAECGRYTDDGVPDVYAWLEVEPEDFDAWWAIATSVNGLVTDEIRPENIEMIKKTNARVVKYGTDYRFRASKSRTILMPLDEEMYNTLKAADYEGFYDAENVTDNNGAVVTTQDKVVVVPDTKFSMVSQFVLPENATLVETGVLLTAKRGETPASTLPLRVNNAGSDTGIVRVKSTSHTAANQYVISVRSSSLSGQTLDSIDLRWAAYMIYKIGDTTYTIYSPETTPSNLDATL